MHARPPRKDPVGSNPPLGFASFCGALAFATLALLGGPARAGVDFERDVQPIFQRHCLECHGEKKQKAGLRLDIREDALRGGESNVPALVPGDEQKSQLLRFIVSQNKDERMPPNGEGPSAREITMLKTWISEGAHWPEKASAKKADPRTHWAFQAVRAPQPPAVRDAAWPRNGIDAFLLAHLEAEGLAPSPEASRSTWLRRVYLDLTGLPPEPAALEAFLKDSDPGAYASVVETLLQSPRYGERWAQHWLDVVRYADTHGFEVNTERPTAWPYRDYVIRAFNEDRPYDQFVREQIAGDALGRDAATGFLVTASVLLPGQIGADDASKRLARQDALDEILVNTAHTFLGLSAGCARCHDHKSDPIPQRDYYAFQAFFAGVEYLERKLNTPESEQLRAEERRLRARAQALQQDLVKFTPAAFSGHTRPPVNPVVNTDKFARATARKLRFTINATNNREPYLDELEVWNTAGVNVALASAGAKASASHSTQLAHIHDGVYGNNSCWISKEKGKGWVELEFPGEETFEMVRWGRDRDGKFSDRLATEYRIEIETAPGQWRTLADSSDRAPHDPKKKGPENFAATHLPPAEAAEMQRLQSELAEVNRSALAAARNQMAFAGSFRAPDKIHRLHRGDPEQPREAVLPAVLSALGSLEVAEDAPEQERRMALARWIASPDNPLTARVMVNRLWQWHFGTGIVETSSDFGMKGMPPSHPLLLDWLAAELVRSGWSLKHLHKLITLSATYRQSSQIGEANTRAQTKDAEARWLWRFPSRRLEGEAIRDAMLWSAGRLNLKMGGPGYNLFNQRGGLSGYTPVESFKEDGLRRMIYAHKVRRERDPVFGAFDCPDGGQSTARRRESTTPIQALNLLNSVFTLETAEALAARVLKEAGDDLRRQVAIAFRLTLGREPTPVESDLFLPEVREQGLAPLCRALFNSNEFTFLP